MGIADDLKKEAKNAAEGALTQLKGLCTERDAIRGKLLPIEKRIESVIAAPTRVESYEPFKDGEPQCPVCWVKDGIESRLRPIDSPDQDDWFRCGRCGYEDGFEA